MQFLKPVVVKPALYDPLEKEISRYFYELIYEPLYEAVEGELGRGWFKRMRQLQNATRPELEEYFNQALRSGRIQYTDGQFRGLIDAKISRYLKDLGAHYNPDWKSWGLPEHKLTANIRASIGVAQVRYENLSQTIFDKLDQVERAAQDINVPMERVFERIVQGLDVQATDSLRSVLIEAEISPGLKDFIAKEYTRNLNYYIKGDVGAAVARIRRRVQDKLLKIYAETGETPEAVMKRAQEDPVFRQKLLEEDAIKKAFEEVKKDPVAGDPWDVMATIKPDELKSYILQRGAAIRDKEGNVVVQGRALNREKGTNRNFGLTKMIFKHGIAAEEAALLPSILRAYEPLDYGKRKEWVVKANEKENFVIATAEVETSKETITTMYRVPKEEKPDLSKKRLSVLLPASLAGRKIPIRRFHVSFLMGSSLAEVPILQTAG